MSDASKQKTGITADAVRQTAEWAHRVYSSDIIRKERGKERIMSCIARNSGHKGWLRKKQ